MAFTKKDILLLEAMFTKHGEILKHDLRAEWRSDLRIALKQQREEIARDIRDEMDQKFAASERKMTAVIRQEVNTSEQRLMNEIRGMNNVLVEYFSARFEAIEMDIVHIKQHVGMEK